MSVYKRGNSWRAEAWVAAKRVKSKSGFRTKADAQRWQIETIDRYASDTSRSAKSKKAVPSHSFDDLLDKFAQRHLPTVKIESQRRYLVDIECRIKPFFRYFRLSKINAELLEDFKSHLMRSGLSPKSINNCLDLLRLVFNKAVKWGWMESSPYNLDRLRTSHGKYSWWDDQSHIRRFLTEASHSPYHAAFRLGLECGLRLGEIVGLSKQDVSFDLKTIHVHRQWNDKEACYGTTKHNKERFIRFNPASELGLALKAAIAASPDPEVIFVTRTGKRVGNRKLAGSLFPNLQEKAEVPKIRFHDLRHTFASWYMIEVGDIWSLMGILGHSNIKTTMRYAHLSSKHQTVSSFSWSQGGPETLQKPVLRVFSPPEQELASLQFHSTAENFGS